MSIPQPQRQYYPERPFALLGLKGLSRNICFYLKHRYLKSKRKLLYCLLPPPWIRNAGDQAQVLAIQAWLQKHFPMLPVLEIDQEQVSNLLPVLRLMIAEDDLIILHSGGNLGDRYMSTESARRLLIRTFKNTRIISLPQTIYFTDTQHGALQETRTREIYSSHNRLTILCRDLRSARLSETLLPHAHTLCIPDFVLSLPSRNSRADTRRILLCLRDDIESALSIEDKTMLMERLPGSYVLIDTRREAPITPTERQSVIEATLDQFEQASVVVTDRFHGLIFAILCKRPCIALSTIGHKMSYGVLWFRKLPFIRWAERIEDVPALIEECKQCQNYQVPDWNQLYFDQLPEALGLVHRHEWTVTSALFDSSSSAGQKAWILHSQYQEPQEVDFTPDGMRFSGQTRSNDKWCYVYLDPKLYPWTDISWQMKVQRASNFREFAFNFRYQDFDNRYRYRFEAGRVFFDRRIEGIWENNMGSVPFDMRVGEWYDICIKACGHIFRIYVNGELLMQNFDHRIKQGSICVILWETDSRTNLMAFVEDIKVFGIVASK